MVLTDAVELAVTQCIKEEILEEFLRENRAEVISMSIFEFDEEREWKLIREDEYQYGLEEGLKEGRRAYMECICKKLRKGKDIKTIAEELEEEISIIEKIYETAKNFAPDYNVDEILKAEY